MTGHRSGGAGPRLHSQGLFLLDLVTNEVRVRAIGTLLVRHHCPDSAPQNVVIDPDTGSIL